MTCSEAVPTLSTAVPQLTEQLFKPPVVYLSKEKRSGRRRRNGCTSPIAAAFFFPSQCQFWNRKKKKKKKKKPIDFGFFLHFSHKKIQLHFNTLLLIDDFDDFDSFTMEKCSSDSIGSSQTFKAESKSPSILCTILSNWSRSRKWHGDNRFGNHSSGFTDSSYSNYNTFVGWIQPDRNCFSFV